VCACGTLPAKVGAAETGAQLKSIISRDHRTPKYAARDRYRYPYETLTFFGLRPDMTVVEIWPGGGWYTEILAPFLKGSGKYYVEHRADPDEFPGPQTLSGYVQEAQVREMAEAAGFKFVAKSEINANPKDNRDHPKGVWTLPPSLRLKDKNRAKYLGIGESDRMMLKFVKPVH